MPSSKKRTTTPHDLYLFELISSTRLAADGKNVVYSQQWVEKKTEKKYANLWIVSTEAGDPVGPRQFTFGSQRDDHPRWSPDGSQIAFLSNRGDSEKPSQVYLIPFGGGEAHSLTDLPAEILDFVWSPDGKRLVCSVRKLDPEALDRQKDEQKNKLGVVARHYSRVFYKLDGYGYLPHERTHLWVVDSRTGKARQLTEHALYDEQQPAWSPDGRWIAFVSNRSPNPDFNLYAQDIYLLPAAGGEMRKIEAPVGEKLLPSFSPDGRWIAYYANETDHEEYKNMGLWIVPSDGSQPPCNLTEKYDLHASSWTINDLGQPEMMPPTWSVDGQTLYFPMVKHGSSLLMSIDRGGENLTTVIGGEGVVGSFSFDRSQDKLAYFYGNLYDPGQVYLRDTQNGDQRKLTQVNKALFELLELGVVETYWIKGPDGNRSAGVDSQAGGFRPCA